MISDKDTAISPILGTLLLIVLCVAPMASAYDANMVTDDFSHQSGLFTGGYLKIHDYPLGTSHNQYDNAMMDRYIRGLNTRMQNGYDEIEILSVEISSPQILIDSLPKPFISTFSNANI